MLQNEQINICLKDIINFPKPIDLINYKDISFAISPTTANWLVLKSDFQKLLLSKMEDGLSIGECLSFSQKKNKESEFESLISQIIAKKFGSINSPPPSLHTPSITKSIYIYVTNKCNLKCTHCYMYSGKQLPNELSLKSWLVFLQQFKDIGGKTITLTGGEILEYDNWKEIIRFAYDLDLKIVILTNGTKWTEEDIEFAQKYIQEIQISIDGPNEEINSMTRGKGNFEMSVSTAIAFANSSVSTSIATTPTPDTIDIIGDNYIEFSNKLKKETNGKIHFRISQKLLNGRHYKSLNPKKAEHYYLKGKEISNQIRPTYSVDNFSLNHQPNQGYKNCGWGGFSISSNGDIFLCNRISEINSIGHFPHDNLRDILPTALHYYKLSSGDNVTPCKECSIKYICGGGCRIDDFSFKGDHKLLDEKTKIKSMCSKKNKERIYEQMLQTSNYMYEF